jgi:class 3 adenylate cyclase
VPRDGSFWIEVWHILEKCSDHELQRMCLLYLDTHPDDLTNWEQGLEAVRTKLILWLRRQENETIEAFLRGVEQVRPNAGAKELLAGFVGQQSQSLPATPRQPQAPAGGLLKKTVVSVDMVGYSTLARQLDDALDSSAVLALNQRIQGYVDAGLRTVGLSREQSVISDTGDGAIVVFENPDQAHRFAVAFYAAVKLARARRGTEARHQFRLGAATGEILLEWQDRRYATAGITIARAVRLQGAAAPGNLLVDLPTFHGLSPDVQAEYAGEETVRGKREETFMARRCVLNPEDAAQAPLTEPSPATAAARDTRRAIVTLFSKRLPHQKLDTLIFLLRMPVGAQPPDKLPYNERWNRVLSWADSPGGVGLAQLESELRWLIESEVA